MITLPFGKKKKETKPTEKTGTEEKKTIDEIIAPSAILISHDHIQIGEKFVRVLFITNYPRFLNLSWFSSIINLNEALDISFHIHPQSSAVVLKKLRDKLARLQAQIIEEQSSGRVRDPILETATADIETLRDKIQQGTDKFFELGIYVAVYGNTIEEVNKIENQIRTSLESQLIYLKPGIFRMADAFISTIPTGMDKINIHSSMNTDPLSSTFPFVSYNLSTDKGILYGINLHNNSLILYDRFDLPNYNSVVFGSSGSGKSYAIKLEIMRSMIYGMQVFIIDPEEEYRYLAETLGGSFMKVSIASPNHINLFDLPKPREDESPEDVYRTHVLYITGLLKLMMGKLTPEESSILDEGINQTYAIKDIIPGVDFSGMEPPLLSDLQNILESIEGAESLVTRLKKFTEGTFSGFLNQPTNISLDNQLMVFSIRDMEDELKPIAMYLILNHIWTRIRTELQKRLLVIDEAWWLLKQEDGALFLLNVAKRARKYFLGLTTISQDVPDFLDSPYGKPLITNSSIQLLMKQSPAAIEQVKKTFNLTEAEKFTLLESRVGNGLFFIGSYHVATRIVASYTEDQIITSDPRQLLEIKEAKEEWAKTKSEVDAEKKKKEE